MQLDKICRLCLKEGNMLSIFTKSTADFKNLLLSEMLSFCVSINISENDELPSKICLQCIEELERSYTFKQRCQNSDQLLRSINFAELNVKNEVNNYEITIEEDFKVKKEDNTVATVVCQNSDQLLRSINFAELDIKNEVNNDEITIEEDFKVKKEDSTEYNEKGENEIENSFKQFNDITNDEIIPENKDFVKNLQTYSCNTCGLTFETHIDLKTHRLTNHPCQRSRNCSICNKVFEYSCLRRHMRTHTKEKPYGCNVCGKKFSQNGNLLRHMKIHTDKQPTENKEKAKNSIKQSYDITDKETTPKEKMQQTIVCKICNLTFETRGDLKTHHSTVKHSRRRPHNCSICGKVFTYARMQAHMRSHTKEQPFSCNICGNKFNHSGNLSRHMKIHTGDRPHKCHLCEKAFIQKPTLINHLRIHSGEKIFSCEFCEKKFTQSAQLREHLKTHPDNETGGAIGTEGIHECDICQRRFYTKNLLKHHKLIHGEKSHLCSYCGKGFVSMLGLKSHLKVHTGIRPYNCDVCGKTFRHIGSLKSHKLVHTGEKPFVCEICNRAFTQQAHLKYHLRIHSGDKRYSCLICDKKFALKGNLTTHMRIHTGETPHLCPTCGKGFYDTSSRKKHMKVHEKQNNS